MQTSGLFPGNAALQLTRRGAAGRVARTIYAQKLAESSAARAVNTALDTRVFTPRNFPYQGFAPGFSGFGDPTESDTDAIVFNADGSINEGASEVGGVNMSTGAAMAIPSNITATSWTPTYSADVTGASNGSGSSWTNVLTSFFGNVGKGIGTRIAGGNVAGSTVPLPSSGPSTTTVLAIAALVGIPAIYLLTRKG